MSSWLNNKVKCRVASRSPPLYRFSLRRNLFDSSDFFLPNLEMCVTCIKFVFVIPKFCPIISRDSFGIVSDPLGFIYYAFTIRPLQLVIVFLVHRPHQFLQNAKLQKCNNARAQISRDYVAWFCVRWLV